MNDSSLKPVEILRRCVPDGVAPLPNIPSYLSRLFLSRGVIDSNELDLALKGMCHPDSLKGLARAVSLLEQGIVEDKRLLIVGDFDCDGATSTALAMLALGRMGARQCHYLVPNRFHFGYGLSPEIVDEARKFSPDIIITVDNGISSVEGVNRAKELGIEVIITDHHLAGETLPDAAAIVNPNQPGCEFAFKSTAGVGVIFYVMCALRQQLRRSDWFGKAKIAEPNLAELLDLVALGTVADLVPLERNNRILVEQGLRRIRGGQCRPGILALLSLANRDYRQVSSSEMGFVLGPRLNAAGRMDDMSVGIECLLADDANKAQTLARQLDELNRDRKTVEAEMKADAENWIREQNWDVDNLPWGLSLFEAHWHQGVIGILASRIKEKLHRPVVVFAPADDAPSDNPQLKGSARSIPGLHIRDALDRVAKTAPGLLLKFGGHAMAAGMTIEQSRYQEFADAFDRVVRDLLCEDDLRSCLITDGELEEQELSLETAKQLSRAAPWGQQFPPPVFDGIFRVVQAKVVGSKHLKMVLSMRNSTQLIDAIQFNSPWCHKIPEEQVRLVYQLDVNQFRGRQSLQLIVDYLEPVFP